MWFILTILPFASAQECETRLPNLIKTQNITVCGELNASNLGIAGRMATSGDANLSHYTCGFDRPDARWSVTIGDTLTTEQGSIARGLRVNNADASSIADTVTYDELGTHNKNIDARCLEAQSFSEGLAAFEDTGTANFDGYATLTLEGEGSHSVFTVDSDTLSSSRLVLIDAGRHVLIRVTGDNVAWGNGSIVSTSTDPKRILWVMDEASELDLYSADWSGTVLATQADTINVNDVNFTGQLVAGNGEATATITSAWFDRARLRTTFEVCYDGPTSGITYAVNYENPDASCTETCLATGGMTCDSEATDALWEDHTMCEDALISVIGPGVSDLCEDVLSLGDDREACATAVRDTIATTEELQEELSAGCITENNGDGGYYEGLTPGGCDATGSTTYSLARVCACSDAPE